MDSFELFSFCRKPTNRLKAAERFNRFYQAIHSANPALVHLCRHGEDLLDKFDIEAVKQRDRLKQLHIRRRNAGSGHILSILGCHAAGGGVVHSASSCWP